MCIKYSEYTKIRLPIEIIDLFNNLLLNNENNIDKSIIINEIKILFDNYIKNEMETNIPVNILECLENNYHIIDENIQDFLQERVNVSNIISSIIKEYSNNEFDKQCDLFFNRIDISELFLKHYKDLDITINIPEIKSNNESTERLDKLEQNISEISLQTNGLTKKEEQSIVDKITAKVKKELQVDNLISTKPNIDTVLLLKEKGLPIEDIVMLHKNGLI